MGFAWAIQFFLAFLPFLFVPGNFTKKFKLLSYLGEETHPGVSRDPVTLPCWKSPQKLSYCFWNHKKPGLQVSGIFLNAISCNHSQWCHEAHACISPGWWKLRYREEATWYSPYLSCIFAFIEFGLQAGQGPFLFGEHSKDGSYLRAPQCFLLIAYVWFTLS